MDWFYYFGKHQHHGVNLQVLVDPRRGDLVWIFDGLPGSAHDPTAAHIHDVIRHSARTNIELLTDKGSKAPAAP